MRLKLTRQILDTQWTLGEIQVFGVPDVPDGSGAIYSCEDTDRELEAYPDRKVKGKSAIPLGSYRIVVTQSKRFGRMLPLLLSVPGFGGIRIHPGNTSADTEGCLLLGSARDPAKGTVSGSRATCNLVQTWIEAAIARGEQVWIDVERGTQ